MISSQRAYLELVHFDEVDDCKSIGISRLVRVPEEFEHRVVDGREVVEILVCKDIGLIVNVPEGTCCLLEF